MSELPETPMSVPPDPLGRWLFHLTRGLAAFGGLMLAVAAFLPSGQSRGRHIMVDFFTGGLAHRTPPKRRRKQALMHPSHWN